MYRHINKQGQMNLSSTHSIYIYHITYFNAEKLIDSKFAYGSFICEPNGLPIKYFKIQMAAKLVESLFEVF